MRFRAAAIAPLAVLAAVAAGCGSTTSVKPFTAAATAPCLKTNGFTGVTTAAGKVGFIAGFAQNGGIRATASDGNTVTIAFTAGQADVAGTKAAFTRQAPAKLKSHMRDILEVQGNAVLVWTTSPSQQALDLALGCLHS
jgi:hypothetical protein